MPVRDYRSPVRPDRTPDRRGGKPAQTARPLNHRTRSPVHPNRSADRSATQLPCSLTLAASIEMYGAAKMGVRPVQDGGTACRVGGPRGQDGSCPTARRLIANHRCLARPQRCRRRRQGWVYYRTEMRQAPDTFPDRECRDGGTVNNDACQARTRWVAPDAELCVTRAEIALTGLQFEGAVQPSDVLSVRRGRISNVFADAQTPAYASRTA